MMIREKSSAGPWILLILALMATVFIAATASGEDFYLAGLRRAEREDPTVHGGDESGALCPNTKNYKSDKGNNDLITCTAQ